MKRRANFSLMAGKHESGFTLVELIATLIIVALVLTFAGPRFFSLQLFRDRGFYEETLSAVRYAQKHAVATGCTVRVEITINGFTLYRPASTATCTTGPYTAPIADPSGNAATFTRTRPPNVTLSAHDFTFAPNGSASANQSITVGASAIQVVAATGYVGR